MRLGIVVVGALVIIVSLSAYHFSQIRRPPVSAGKPVILEEILPQGSRLLVRGSGSRGAQLNVLLNGTQVARPTVGNDGSWSLTVDGGLVPGGYILRAEELDSRGNVLTRAEQRFINPPEGFREPLSRPPEPMSPKAIPPGIAGGQNSMIRKPISILAPKISKAAPTVVESASVDQAFEEDAIQKAIEARERPAKMIIEYEKAMRPREPYTARLMLERGLAGEKIEAIAEKTIESSIEQNIRVASDVRATAFGNKGMKVTMLSKDEWQTLLPGKPTYWTWNVEAPAVGQYQLTIDLHQKVFVGKVERIVTVESFPHVIDVSVGWWEQYMSVLGDGIGVATDTADMLTKLLGGIIALGTTAMAFLTFFGRRRTA